MSGPRIKVTIEITDGRESMTVTSTKPVELSGDARRHRSQLADELTEIYGETAAALAVRFGKKGFDGDPEVGRRAGVRRGPTGTAGKSTSGSGGGRAVPARNDAGTDRASAAG